MSQNFDGVAPPRRVLVRGHGEGRKGSGEKGGWCVVRESFYPNFPTCIVGGPIEKKREKPLHATPSPSPTSHVNSSTPKPWQRDDGGRSDIYFALSDRFMFLMAGMILSMFLVKASMS